ncbi:MAG: response regulator, partial [Rhodospirillaceae bacterium]
MSLSAKVRDVNDGRTTITICICDNGIGMDADTQARVFQPFEQADNATTRRFGGTGLGLVISHSLVTQMGGHVELESAAGKGSTFNIHLPLNLPVTQPLSQSPISLTGLTFILVGLSDPARQTCTAYLKHAGAQVFHTPTLDAAHMLLAKHDMEVNQSCILLQGWTAADSDALDGSSAGGLGKANHPIGAGLSYLRLEPGLHGQLQRVDAQTITIGQHALSRKMLLEAVSLACGRTAQQPQPAKDDATKISYLSQAALREAKMLVAEDNLLNQEVIARQLALLGMQADVVPNGQAAYEKWVAGDYAVILTDLHMPVWDGYRLTRAVRAEEQHSGKNAIPIIALTANALQGEKERCLEIGMSDYLTKPLEVHRLQQTLEYWLGTSSEWVEAVAEAADGQVGTGPTFTAESPPIDVTAMRELFGLDDMDMFSQFIDKFLHTVGPDIRSLADSLSSNDAEQSRSLGHKVKSSARAIGAHPLADLCQEIEAFASKTWPSDASHYANALLQHFKAIEDYA